MPGGGSTGATSVTPSNISCRMLLLIWAGNISAPISARGCGIAMAFKSLFSLSLATGEPTSTAESAKHATSKTDLNNRLMSHLKNNDVLD